jgi:hypothetical protein
LFVIAYDVNNGVSLLYFVIVKEETNNVWSWFLDLLRWYVIDGHIKLCIISNRHAVIKNFVAQTFPKPIGYYWYCSQHFLSNFNFKLKYVALKNIMCTHPSKQEFDKLY